MLSTIQSLQPDVLYHKQPEREKIKPCLFHRQLFATSQMSASLSQKSCALPYKRIYLRYFTSFWDGETALHCQSPLRHQHSKGIHPLFSSISQKRVISEKPLPYTGNILRTLNGLIPFSQHPSNERFHSLSPNDLVSKIQA